MLSFKLDVLILKIIFKNKKILFNIFLNKKYFKKELQLHLQSNRKTYDLTDHHSSLFFLKHSRCPKFNSKSSYKSIH